MEQKIHDITWFRRSYIRSTQRKQIHSRVRHGEHGRTQAWRICPYPYFQGALRQ